MTKIAFFSSVLCVTIFLFSCQETKITQSADDQLAFHIDSLVNSYYQSHEFSGAVLVADGGAILLNKEYGFTDIDSTKLIDAESVFEIASISKQFTALLIMMEKENGNLDYDDKIIKYFPYLPYENISIRHLLTHTSGLSERKFFMWAGQNMDPSKIYTNQTILAYLEQEKPELAFVPGEKWEYSNLGYFLLPLILEQTSGKTYINLLNERIFDPLGMTHTGIYSQSYKGTEMDNYVFGKVMNPQDSSFMSSFGMAWSDSIYGGVGIISNTTDLQKWDRALYTDRLINQEAMAEAFEAYSLTDGATSKYGFGWFVKDQNLVNGIDVGKSVNHHGIWPGYESSIVRFIDKDKTIIILSNQSPSVKDELLEVISILML